MRAMYNEGHKYCFNIIRAQGGVTSLAWDKSSPITIYFPCNGKSYGLEHDRTFNRYRIVWDDGSLPGELDQWFTSTDKAGIALATYLDNQEAIMETE